MDRKLKSALPAFHGGTAVQDPQFPGRKNSPCSLYRDRTIFLPSRINDASSPVRPVKETHPSRSSGIKLGNQEIDCDRQTKLELDNLILTTPANGLVAKQLLQQSSSTLAVALLVYQQMPQGQEDSKQQGTFGAASLSVG
jgi:hypothetical protein